MLSHVNGSHKLKLSINVKIFTKAQKIAGRNLDLLLRNAQFLPVEPQEYLLDLGLHLKIPPCLVQLEFLISINNLSKLILSDPIEITPDRLAMKWCTENQH